MRETGISEGKVLQVEGTASTKALRQEVPGIFEKQQGTSVIEWGGEQRGRTEFPILAPEFLAE